MIDLAGSQGSGAGDERRGPVRAVGGILSAITMSAGLVAPVPAQAAGTDCEFSDNYLTGRQGVPRDFVYGSATMIEFRQASLCGDDNTGPDFNTAWTMVVAFSRNPLYDTPAEDPDGSEQGYAQAGYIRTADPNGYAYHGISEWGQYSRACNQDASCTGGSFINVWGAPSDAGENPPSGSQLYWTEYDWNDSAIHMYAGSRELGETNYNLTSSTQGWRPEWRVANYGETIHRTGDVPGTTSNHANFDGIEYLHSDGNWNDVVTYGDCEEPAPTITERFHCEDETPTSGNHAFDIWTAPL